MNTVISECITYLEKKSVWSLMDDVYGNKGYAIDNYSEYVEKVCKNAIIIKASDNGKTVGFIAFYANDSIGKKAYITQIAVSPEFQRRGIGEKLIEASVRKSESAGMDSIKLEVAVDNTSAFSFYHARGFLKTEDSTGNKIFMSKIIRKEIDE